MNHEIRLYLNTRHSRIQIFVCWDFNIDWILPQLLIRFDWSQLSGSIVIRVTSASSQSAISILVTWRKLTNQRKSAHPDLLGQRICDVINSTRKLIWPFLSCDENTDRWLATGGSDPYYYWDRSWYTAAFLKLNPALSIWSVVINTRLLRCSYQWPHKQRTKNQGAVSAVRGRYPWLG